METEVLIVGAGPTGLALACQMIRYGVDFVIIDKNETTTPHSKAIGVQARTLEIYEQIGLARELIGQGEILEKVRMVVGGKVRGEIVFKDIGAGLSPYPFVLAVEQGRHETILYDFVTTHGKEVRWQTELVSFSQNEAGVLAEIKTPSDQTETIEAKYLVGCDGAKSPVRHSLGLKFEGGTLERNFYVADVEIDWEFSHDAVACMARHAATAFFPMPGSDKNFRIVGVFPDGLEKDEGEILYEEVERQIIADTDLDLDITRVNWFSVYKVHSRCVENFSNGRCFLAGDSAHIHTPAGAQGMNTGIQDGYNLAWKIAMVLRGKADDKILDTYNEERLPNAKRLIERTDRAFQFIANPNWFFSFFRTKIVPLFANFVMNLRFAQKRIFPLASQIGINYRKSALSKGDANFSVRAGDRMPYFMVDGESIYDRIREPKFHLLVFSDGSSPLSDAEESLGELYDMHAFPLYPNIAEIFGAVESFCIVLRPDNYIGLISSDTSPGAVRGYLGYAMGK